jgi:hypothetical protein
MRMKPKDLYRLRRMQLHAQRQTLQAQMAHHRLQEFTLELERQYDLLAREATLNVHTGEITLPTAGEVGEGGPSGASLKAIAPSIGIGGGPMNGKEVSYGPAHDAIHSAP